MKTIALGYLGLITMMSLVTFAVYGIDKYQARKGAWRIPERLLHRLAFWGGWPGAWLGQQFFRHKTQKRGFQFMHLSIIAMHLSLIAVVVYFWISGVL